MSKWDEPSDCAIGRYGQTTSIVLVSRWCSSSLLRFAQDTTVWFNTAVMRDDELQNLPIEQHIDEFRAALHGESNRFSKYVQLTKPEGVTTHRRNGGNNSECTID